MSPRSRKGTLPNPPLGLTYPTPWPVGFLDMGVATDIGTRKENQDAFHLDPLWGVAAVADGMGGEGTAGALAANAAVGQVKTVLSTRRHLPGGPKDLYQSAASHVRSSLSRVGKHGGTVLTILDLAPNQAGLAWGGDVAAIYVPERGPGVRMTMPHNIAGTQLRQGKITEDQYRDHPNTNILTHGILPKDAPAPEVRSGPAPQVGDSYVLCTDGLFDLLGTARITGIVQTAPMGTPSSALANGLLDAARSVGLSDNATVVVVCVRRLPAQPGIGIRAR